MSSPEMNAFNTDAMKAAWVQMFGNDNDFVKVISNMGGQVSQDEKGIYWLIYRQAATH